MEQQQFLNVLDRDEAERRFRAVLDLSPLAAEQVSLPAALGRVLAGDVVAPLDVPSFDRSNVDGFAVQAADTFGASEDRPRSLHISAESLATGVEPREPVRPGTATAIATGAMLPRGADAVGELGCEPVPLGIVPDDDRLLDETLHRALAHDAILLSGGTSKGVGDLSYRAVARLGRPGIVAHGVALKPGKPLCLAAVQQ